jgi:transcription elongation factor Elf1
MDLFNGIILEDDTHLSFPSAVSKKVAPREITIRNHPAYNRSGEAMQLQATADINTDEYIGTYGGKLLFVDADGESDWSPYQMAPDATATYYIDAVEIGNELRYINDCKGVGSKTPNVGFFQSRRKFRGYFMTEVYAIKPIKAGEELLVSYGEEYWGLLKKWYEEKHPFDCPNCEYRTISKSNLRQHIKFEVSVPLHECLYCGHCFKTYDQLNRHRNIHTAETLYRCEEDGCDFFSLHRSSIVNHMANAHAEATFKCFYCDKTFKSSGLLKNHSENNHDGERPFSCTICDYRAKIEDQLKYHIQRIHKPKTSVKRSFECPYDECNYKSELRDSIKRHVEGKHEKRRNFRCPHYNCGFLSYRIDGLKVHLRKMHDDDA